MPVTNAIYQAIDQRLNQVAGTFTVRTVTVEEMAPGARLLIMPSTVLTRDVWPGDTSIEVRDPVMTTGDLIYLSAGGIYEVMRVTGAGSGTGPYTYPVTRQVRGTAANPWPAGQAVLVTGQAGSPIIELYTRQSVRSAAQKGPTVAGYIQQSQTPGDAVEVFALGNLKGLYGYSADVMGVGLGQPGAGRAWLTIDPTSGIRLMTGPVTAPSVAISLDPAGNAFFSGRVVSSQGQIGGWTIEATAFSAPGATLDAGTPALKLGGATGYMSGTGFWVGKDADGVYKLHIGNPAGDHLRWDGANLTITGYFIGSADIGSTRSAQFLINSARQDVTVGLVLGRTTGGDASLTWDGAVVSLNKPFLVSGGAGGVSLRRATATTPISIALQNEIGELAGEFAVAGAAGHFSTLAAANDLVIRNTGGNKVIIALGNDLNNWGAGGITGYPSGGVYIGSSPVDPGANNLRVQGSIAAASGVFGSAPGGTETLRVQSLRAGASVFTADVQVQGLVGIGTAPAVKLHVVLNNTPQVRIGYDTVNYADLAVNASGNLTIAPVGDIVVAPAGKDVLPNLNYDTNLGALNKKYLTLHAAELWVETLVAQQTVATIGGRIVVAPTTQLTADVAPADTSIQVKHNNLAVGDILYLEAAGKVEFMRVTSGPTGTGPYTYGVTRNLDGTGGDQWFAGDAVVDLGQAGNGFIDIYSVRGVKAASQAGPTIVGNVRNSATFNDWTEHWAIGNLNGLYGYGSNVFGVGLGKYGADYITIDGTNGIRFFSGNVLRAQLTASVWTLGDTSGPHVRIEPTRVSLRNGAAERIWLDNVGNAFFQGQIQAGSGQIGGWNITASQLSAGSVVLDSAIPAIRLGNATGFGTGVGIWMGQEAGVYKFRLGDPAGARVQWDGSSVLVKGTINADTGYLGTLTINGTLTVNPGNIVAGQGAVTIDNNGIVIATGPDDFSQTWKMIRWVTGAQRSVWVGGAISSGSNYTTGQIRAESPDGTGYSAISVVGANTGIVTPSAVYISAVVGGTYNQIRLEHTGHTLIQGPNTPGWPPYAIFRTWPTDDDLTIRSNNRHLFCIGRMNGYLTGNTYWDGTNWNNFDTNAYGIIAVSAASHGFFGVYYTSPGANPRPVTELARLAWVGGGQTAHILRANNGAYTGDWPAGWVGGLTTWDISCSGVYYSVLTQRSDPRSKTNIRPIADRLLEKLTQLEPVEFEWRDQPGRTCRGLTADQVAAVLPELCEHDADGNPVGYSLSELVVYLLKAVKELKAELDALKGGH
jgi:hypothetical protein